MKLLNSAHFGRLFCFRLQARKAPSLADPLKTVHSAYSAQCLSIAVPKGSTKCALLYLKTEADPASET